MSIEEYNGLSDAYLDSLVSKLEELAEKDEKIDVEFSVCLYLLSIALLKLSSSRPAS